MTTREMLRSAAHELWNASQSPNPLYTKKMLALYAALRVVADRLTVELASARDAHELGDVFEVLARIDAPPDVDPSSTQQNQAVGDSGKGER